MLPNPLIPLLRTGDPVIAGLPNRIFSAIDENMQYLWQVLQAAHVGSTIFAHLVTVADDTEVGSPVFFNARTKRFENGLASAETDIDSGLLVMSPSADIWGVVYSKQNATLADVLLYGYAPLDLSAVVDGPTVAGTYFLSGTDPGHLVVNRLPVAIPILRADGQGNVFVAPNSTDLLDRHVHYHFSLAAEPAGHVVPPHYGERHVILGPDPARRGWLPAHHAIFDGHAPPGAAFGYNLDADPHLKKVWPPLPIDQCTLFFDKGLDIDVSGTSVPLGLDGLVAIDRYGIWWMSDCYGDVPWPRDLDGFGTSFSDGVDIECPRSLEMRLDLYFSRLNFITDETAVTSLKTLDPRIKIVARGTQTPALTGDLDIYLDLSFLLDADDTRGGRALKGIIGGNKFLKGWVAEGLYSTDPTIVLSGEHQEPIDPEDDTSPTLHSGKVAVSSQALANVELLVPLVRLDGVTEERFDDRILYLEFPAGEDTGIISQVHVPVGFAALNPKMKLRFRIFGSAIGALPQLTIMALRLARNANPTQQAMPTQASEFAVTMVTVATLTVANKYIEFLSSPFAVAPGDIVHYTVTRGSSDGYNGAVGLLEQVAVLTGG